MLLWILFINISPRRRLSGRKTDLSLEMNGTTLESGDRCHRKHEFLMFSIIRSQRVLAFGADPVDGGVARHGSEGEKTDGRPERAR